MTGTSRWIFHIDNMFMHEDLTVQIEFSEDDTVTYYAVTEKGLRPFPSDITKLASFDGDTLEIVTEVAELKGMKIKIVVEFEEDTAKGYFKLPIIGKLKFDGERAEVTELPVLPEKTKEELTEKAKEKIIGEPNNDEN